MEYSKIIARNLKRLVYESGKSQEEIAKYMGVSRTSITNWCSGVRTPKMDKIDKLCELFGCKRSDIMEDRKELTTDDLLKGEMLELINTAKHSTAEELTMAADMLKRLQAYRSLLRKEMIDNGKSN